jgi:hypothetical protein
VRIRGLAHFALPLSFALFAVFLCALCELCVKILSHAKLAKDAKKSSQSLFAFLIFNFALLLKKVFYFYILLTLKPAGCAAESFSGTARFAFSSAKVII